MHNQAACGVKAQAPLTAARESRSVRNGEMSSRMVPSWRREVQCRVHQVGSAAVVLIVDNKDSSPGHRWKPVSER